MDFILENGASGTTGIMNKGGFSDYYFKNKTNSIYSHPLEKGYLRDIGMQGWLRLSSV